MTPEREPIIAAFLALEHRPPLRELSQALGGGLTPQRAGQLCAEYLRIKARAPQPPLELDLHASALSKRAVRALAACGARRVGDIERVKAQALLEVWHVGLEAVLEIAAFARSAGLVLEGEELLPTSSEIWTSDLPLRAKKVLARFGIERVSDLGRVRLRKLQKERNCDSMTIAAIEHFAWSHGVPLKWTGKKPVKAPSLRRGRLA